MRIANRPRRSAGQRIHVMNKQRARGAFMGLVAVAALAGACSEDPSVYLGGPPGADDHQAISSSKLTIVVGDSVLLGARTEDVAGNATPTTPSIAACSDGVAVVGSSATSATFAASAWVRGAALGAGCVTVTSGGIVDTVRIQTGPAGVVLEGPDVVGSGNADSFSVVAVDVAGNALTGTTAYTWSSSTPSRLSIHPETGEVRGKGTGAVTVRVVAPGGANAQKSVTVAAGTFEGTLSLSTSAATALVTATRVAGMEPWDGDTGVRVGVFRALVESFTADDLVFAVPSTGTTGAQTLTFTNIGSSQIAQTVLFTVNTTGHAYSPASDVCATAPDLDANMSAAGWVYFTFTNTSVGWGGPNPDVWFKIDGGASGRTVDARLEWSVPTNASPYADADLYVYAVCPPGGTPVRSSAQYNPPALSFEQVSDLVVPAGETRYLQVRVWDAQGAAVSTARLRAP